MSILQIPDDKIPMLSSRAGAHDPDWRTDALDDGVMIMALAEARAALL